MSKVIWSLKIDEILNKGISLEPLGVKNWALFEQDALMALKCFANLHIPILGGDVCELIDGIIQYNYDNWHCDRLPNESNLDFANRSITKARKYIEQYNINGTHKILFAFVPDIL